MKQKMSIEYSSKRRKTALLLLLITSGGVAALIYFEQIEILYVLATLALIALLLAVGFADLENVGRGDESVNSAASSIEETEQNQSATQSLANRKFSKSKG